MLVGAHQYSFTELFWRWVKKNRIFLGVSAAAVVVIGILSTLNYIEVKGERDRAKRAEIVALTAKDQEEAAKLREEKLKHTAEIEAEDLKLQAARDALDKDPQLALSWLKSLDASKKAPNWGAVRTIAADALSRGVPTWLGADWNNTGEGHSGQISSLSFSPDGKLLASTSVDNTVKLWSMEGGAKKLAQTLEGHTDRVLSGAFSPDGKLFASGGAEKESAVRLWDVATGKQLALFTGHTGKVRFLAFSSDGARLVSAGTDGVVRLWDIAAMSNTPIELKGHTGDVLGFSLSSTGSALATIGADGQVLLWDLTKQRAQVLQQYSAATLTQLSFSPDSSLLAWVGSDQATGAGIFGVYQTQDKKAFNIPAGQWGLAGVRFSPDGRQLLLFSADAPSLLLVQTQNCTPKVCAIERLLSHTEGVNAAVFSPDSKTILSGSHDQTIKLWDTQTKSAYRTLRGSPDAITLLSLSSDGRSLASASLGSSVLAWDLAALEEKTFSGHTGVVRDVAFSPDGKLLASSSDDMTVRVWSFAEERLLYNFSASAPVFSISFSPDGKLLAAVDNKEVKLWSLTDGTLQRSFKGHADLITGINFSPDGKRVVSASADRSIKCWDTLTGENLWTAMLEATGAISATFSPNSSVVASIGFDRQLRFWNASTGKLLSESPVDGCARSTFSPDAVALLVSGCGSAPQLWEVKGAALGSLRDTLRGHKAAVFSAMFSPDGKRAATPGYDDVARIFDLATKESRALPSHGADVEAVAFSPDGTRLAIASDDTQVHVFVDDLPTESTALQMWLAGLQLAPK